MDKDDIIMLIYYKKNGQVESTLQYSVRVYQISERIQLSSI